MVAMGVSPSDFHCVPCGLESLKGSQVLYVISFKSNSSIVCVCVFIIIVFLSIIYKVALIGIRPFTHVT